MPPENDNTERSDVANGKTNNVASVPFSDNTPRQLYPASFRDDVEQINHEMDRDNAGVKKLSVNDKWELACSNALRKETWLLSTLWKKQRPSAKLPKAKVVLAISQTRGWLLSSKKTIMVVN